MTLSMVSDAKKKTSRKRFYTLLSVLVSCCFADYVFGLYIPQVVFVAIALLIAATGDTDEIAALCMCCIPLHTYLEFAFVILFSIVCHVLKNGDKIRIGSCIVPVMLMVLWELLHCFIPNLNVMQFGGHCMLWLMLAVFMCTSGHEFDYEFIVRAMVLSTLVMCYSLLGRLLYMADWNLSGVLINLYRLGVEEEYGVSKVNPNSLGIICVFCVSGLLQLRLMGRRGKRDAVMIVMLLLFGVMTASRTFLVCIAFMAFLFLLATKGSAYQKLRYIAAALLVTLVVLGISYIVMPEMLNYYIARFFERDITTGRIDTMGEYHRYLLENWEVLFFGIGLQGFSERILQLCPQAIFVPHNGFQELILAWGMPGILLFAGLWYTMVVQSGKMCKRQGLINYIPFLVLLLKTLAGQMLNSSYTMLAFSFAYLSMCADFTTVDDAQHAAPEAADDGIPLEKAVAFLWKKRLVLIAVAIAGLLTAFGITKDFVTPMYESSALMYVNNSNISLGSVTQAITNGDITVSRRLISTYRTILKSRQTLKEVIDLAGIEETYEEVSEMITADSEKGTEILRINVEHPDPVKAERIANAVAEILPKRVSEIMEGASAEVIDYAVVANKPKSPSKSINGVIGGVIGFVLGAMMLLLSAIWDRRVSEENIAELFSYPVLAAIPQLDENEKNTVSRKG